MHARPMLFAELAPAQCAQALETVAAASRTLLPAGVHCAYCLCYSFQLYQYEAHDHARVISKIIEQRIFEN